jgi:hypothetical protein
MQGLCLHGCNTAGSYGLLTVGFPLLHGSFGEGVVGKGRVDRLEWRVCTLRDDVDMAGLFGMASIVRHNAGSC